jgi:hypothetical protein
MLLNSRLNEVVISTVKSDNISSLKVRKVLDFSPESYSVVSGLRDILHRHGMLCDILELIDSYYSLQVLVFIGSKFAYETIMLFMILFSIFDRSLFPIHSFTLAIAFVLYELIQLVAVVYCCSGVLLQWCIVASLRVFR